MVARWVALHSAERWHWPCSSVMVDEIGGIRLRSRSWFGSRLEGVATDGFCELGDSGVAGKVGTLQVVRRGNKFGYDGHFAVGERVVRGGKLIASFCNAHDGTSSGWRQAGLPGDPLRSGFDPPHPCHALVSRASDMASTSCTWTALR